MTRVRLKIHTPTDLARRISDVREINVTQRLNYPHFRLDTAHKANVNSPTTATPLRDPPQTTSSLPVQQNPNFYHSP